MFLCGLQIIRKNIHNHNPSFTFLFSIIQKQTVFLYNQKNVLTRNITHERSNKTRMRHCLNQATQTAVLLQREIW
jgi:hypothetical protein